MVERGARHLNEAHIHDPVDVRDRVDDAELGKLLGRLSRPMIASAFAGSALIR